MKRFLCTLFALSALCCLALAQTPKSKVAVYVTGDAEASYKKVIGSKIVTSITKSDNYTAIERTADFLSELSKEQEYQMSGAVSDNQIVKIGQQFGVQFVLVADVSEVFQSMFISARMIDVQTGQIKHSAEADAVVESLDGLTLLSEKVILSLLYSDTKDDIKILGPYSTAKALYYYKTEPGYRVATKDEVLKTIKNKKLLGETVSLPVYVDIYCSSTEHHNYFNAIYYSGSKTKDVDQEDHWYWKYTTRATLIKSDDVISSVEASFIDDVNYDFNRDLYNYPETSSKWGCRTSGLEYYGRNDSVPNGYIYLVKDVSK